MPVSNYRDLVQSGRLLHLDEYDHIIVSYSGGKDSLALALFMLEHADAAHEKIELWHQHVDGEPGGTGLMDWPCTESYCMATAKGLNLPLLFQWKHGGFEGEMLRNNSRTQGVSYQTIGGDTKYLPPAIRGKLSTRRLFPQVSADLSVRWCSAYLKIDVARRAINNDERFKNSKILFLTGERRQESTARSKYNEAEEHACSGTKRRVDQWRAIIDWTEEDVWNIIRRHNIIPHPAYRLGWGRVSCMACIFGDRDQWASIRKIAGERFDKIAAYEREFGKTIKKGESIVDQANHGTSFIDHAPDWLIKLAMSQHYPQDQVFCGPNEEWEPPVGAYKRCGGPT
jgi:3'-phosphoadenosine 5'-phosphosulfate sulfotransferase (PAPS reductase)/FAD synthetase